MSATLKTERPYLATDAQVRDLEAIARRLQLFASMLWVMGGGQGTGGAFDYSGLGTALAELADRVNAAVPVPGGVR